MQYSGLAMGASALPNAVIGQANDHATQARAAGATFPRRFGWGSATASYQVEGASQEGAVGFLYRDTFSHRQGRTLNDDTGDVADGFYHLYPQDIALMKDLGLKTFRLSIAWSRVFPTGTGQPNQVGMDFYNRLVDTLLAADIQPYCTLYHWDLPEALQDNGGWENRDTTKAFADCAGYSAGKVSDRVKQFMTMNEMRSSVGIGYGSAVYAPGLKLNAQKLAQLNQFVCLVHGMAVQSIRASAKPGTRVGIDENADATIPVIETPERIEAGRRAMREQNAMLLTAVQEGRYTDPYLKRLGANAPKCTTEEIDIIRTPMDFVGLNVYQPTYIRAAADEYGYAVVPSPSSYPHMYISWLTVGPEALY